MELTKKQVAAIERVICSCASDPRHREMAGEAPVSDGIIITDGAVLIHAPESLGMKQGKWKDLSRAEKMNACLHAPYESGSEFYRVEEPITNGKTSSKLRAILKEHTFVSPDGNHVAVSLSAHDLHGEELSASFDFTRLVSAFEAVGKDAVAYIGRSYSALSHLPYLLVEPIDVAGKFEYGIHAIVLPLRT